ncbi:hypothetical protein D3C81_2256900 [compost metagenome]
MSRSGTGIWPWAAPTKLRVRRVVVIVLNMDSAPSQLNRLPMDWMKLLLSDAAGFGAAAGALLALAVWVP